MVDAGALLRPAAGERVASIVQGGALVSIYRTRDGGALGVTVTLDGESEKEYFRDPDELLEWLTAVDEAVTSAPAVPSRGKRPTKGS